MVTRPPRASAILRIRNPSFNQSATLAPPNPICIESNSFVKHHRFWPNHTETLVFSRSHCKPKYYFGFAQKILHFLDFLVFFGGGGGVWFSKFENFRTEFLIFEELENIGEREREIIGWKWEQGKLEVLPVGRDMRDVIVWMGSDWIRDVWLTFNGLFSGRSFYKGTLHLLCNKEN